MTLDFPLPLGPTTDEKLCSCVAVGIREGVGFYDINIASVDQRCGVGLYLVKGANALCSGIRFKVFEHHFTNNQSRLARSGHLGV